MKLNSGECPKHTWPMQFLMHALDTTMRSDSAIPRQGESCKLLRWVFLSQVRTNDLSRPLYISTNVIPSRSFLRDLFELVAKTQSLYRWLPEVRGIQTRHNKVCVDSHALVSRISFLLLETILTWRVESEIFGDVLPLWLTVILNVITAGLQVTACQTILNQFMSTVKWPQMAQLPSRPDDNWFS